MSDKVDICDDGPLKPGERIISGVDRLIYCKPWLTSTEMAAALGCQPDSVRSAVHKVGDKIRALQQTRIEELLRAERRLTKLGLNDYSYEDE